MAVVVAVVFAVLYGASAAAAQSSYWSLTSSPAPTNLAPGATGKIVVSATNLGDKATEGTITITDVLPAGLSLAGAPRGFLASLSAEHLECTPTKAPSSEPVRCTFAGVVQPLQSLRILIPVKVDEPAGTETELHNEIKAEGGGTPSATEPNQAVKIAAAAAPFGIEKYGLRPEEEGGAADTQAGSHPFQLTTTFALNQTAVEEPVALPRNLQFELPPGLLGDANSEHHLPRCTQVQFTTLAEGRNECPYTTAIGVAEVEINEPATFKDGPTNRTVPIFNLEPAPGEPARFGFVALKDPVVLGTAVRTGSDYGVTVTAQNTSEAAGVLASKVTIWGVPGDPRHNVARGWECVSGESLRGSLPACASQEPLPQAPFVTLPASCERPVDAPARAQSWVPGAPLLEAVHAVAPVSLTGCDLLKFEPSISVIPDEHAGSTPTGLTVDVSLPQDGILSPTGLAEADVKETTLVLPPGVLLNPAAATGLAACSALQVGFLGASEPTQLDNHEFSPLAAECPEAAKVGTVSIKTPLLKNELHGSVYLAAQNTAPFKAPLVIYITAEDKETGVVVKLAGTTTPDPVTGQITSTFENTPQVPFEDLKVHFFTGPRASLSSPPLCGAYTTTASLVPWSTGVAAPASSSFEVTSGPGGSPCSSNPQPFAPAFQGGSLNTQAAAFTPFTLTIAKPDGQQSLNGITVHLPEGMAALLSSVTPCPEPPVGQPWACGAESLLGHATTTSGLGSEPFSLSGNVYITTGYDGAPFGLLVETAAKAGPFDLGLVDVRSRINVDPNTAAVTVTTDGGPRGEIVPTFLKGVPVQLKQINVTIDRPGFQFNGTNCNPTSIAGTLNGDGGTAAAVSSPFQVTGCAGLKFGPKLTAEAGKQGSKNNGDSLNVTVESAGLGQANIKKVSLQLPAALPSRLTTIQKACLAAVFAANPASCPEGSNIGHAKISTPVLKNPLQGPAYLVSYGSAKFPDVEFVLQGEGILLILDGHTDIKKGITYSRFEAAPDAPFSKFVTELPAGPHSALTAFVPVAKNYSLCGTKLLMPTEIVAQNGALIKQTTNIAVKGCSGVLPFKMTRAQKLAKALKACHKKKNKHKRVACEKQARKKYGTHHKAAKKHTKKK
jgi:hypothetical protein